MFVFLKSLFFENVQLLKNMILKRDVTDKLDFSSIQKCTVAIRMLAYEVCR
jgi:hypothetical protein